MPFGPRQFFDVFRQYNEDVWPAQIALSALALVVTAALMLRRHGAGALAKITLCVFFTWSAVVYQWAHFTRINPAAWAFGAMFLGGAALIAASRDLSIGGARGARFSAGIAIAAYAVAGYPFTAYLSGHHFPFVPTFGAPCPVTIFAIGLLIASVPPLPVWPAVVPLLWAAIGSSAAFALGVREDLALTAAGAALLVVLLADRVQSRRQVAAGSGRPK